MKGKLKFVTNYLKCTRRACLIYSLISTGNVGSTNKYNPLPNGIYKVKIHDTFRNFTYVHCQIWKEIL